MTELTQEEVDNLRRERVLRISYAFKELFALAVIPRAWAVRWLFRSDDGKTTRLVGRIVLADLAQFCKARESAFDTDPLIMARRAGRQDVFRRIADFLNLDEDEVRKIIAEN